MAKYVKGNPRRFLFSVGVVAIFSLWMSSNPESISAENEKKGDGTPHHAEPGTSLGAGAYQGPRIRIAIGGLEDKTGASTSFGGEGDICRIPVTTTRNLLTTAIADTGRFDVVELEEPDPGVEYLITGSVDDWRFNPGATESQIRPGRSGKPAATATMSFRVADARTGQVLFATSERAEVDLRNADTGSFSGSGWSDEMSAALRSSVHSCIQQGANRLVRWFVDRPWTGTVSAVEQERIYIAAGSHQGLRVGMTLSALSEGRRLIDPETGQVLGSVTERAGRLRTVEVRERVSIATVIDGCDDLKPGDRVALHL
jgi:hypothetical protein